MSDLIRAGETPDAALRRLERRADYARLLGTEAGQELLREAARQAAQARRETVRA